jgi:hypothetical protein
MRTIERNKRAINLMHGYFLLRVKADVEAAHKTASQLLAVSFRLSNRLSLLHEKGTIPRYNS